MAALESWWEETAPRIEALGRPGMLYLVCEGELVELSVERGRPTPVASRSGRRRRLGADSALARTLRSTATSALGLGDADPKGEPPAAVRDALLQELRAQAALLVRERGQLAAVVCVAALREGGRCETPLAAVAHEVEASWQARGGERIRAELGSALRRRRPGPTWLRRIRARIFAPGPG